MQTMQQKRMKYALDEVESAANAKKVVKYQKEYKSSASGFPAMIQMNGLGQAAAFYRSPDRGQEGTHKRLYDLLSGWLTQSGQPYEGCGDLLKGIIKCNMSTYLLAQAEALELLNWVKKFAKAYMEDK